MNPLSWLGFGSPTPPPSHAAPRPARGLLGWLRETVGAWAGALFARGTPAEFELRREKAAAGPRGIPFPAFLPFFDDQTGESAGMRRAYRAMLADPHVKSALLGKILAVGALDLKMHPADKKRKRHRRVADYAKWQLTERLAGGVPELAWSVLSGACIDGFSVCEKVWDREELGRWAGKYVLTDLPPKQVGDDLVLVVDEFRRVTGIQGLRYNGGLVFSPSNFVIFQHLPLYRNPSGMSDFRAAYGSWWSLDAAKKLRMLAADKRASPVLVGHWKDPAHRAALEEALGLARSQNWIAAPEDAKIEALNLAGQADAIFSEIEKDRKHEIVLAIEGAILQTLEGTVADGRGNSQVHRSKADLYIGWLASRLQTLLNDRTSGLIRDFVDLNFTVNEYPRATLGAVDVNELTQQWQIDAGLHQAGLDLSREELYERYGRQPPETPEDTLKGQAAGGPPGASPGLPFVDTKPAPARVVPARQPFRHSEGWGHYLRGR